jgi:hypothetical protein
MIEKLAISQLVKKVPAFQETQRFTTVTKKPPLVPSSSKIIPDDTRSPALTFIPVLVSYLDLGLTSCQIPSGFHTAFPSNARHMPCLSHSPLLVTSSSDNHEVRHCAVFLKPPVPNIRRILFSNTIYVHAPV